MNAALAVQLLIQLLAQAQSIGAIIAKAHTEGRDLTNAEVDDLVGADNAARLRLQAAIAAATK